MKGSVTIALALSLSFLTGIIFFLTGNAVKNADKIRLEGIIDMAMSSVLGEFHKKLHERYDLLYVDLSYQKYGPLKDNIEQRLYFYIQQNHNPNNSHKPWSGLYLSEIEVTDIKTAAEKNGDSIKNQAIAYKYDCNTQDRTVYGRGAGKISMKAERDAMDEWSSLMEQIDSIELPVIINEHGQEETIALDNPADAVFEMAGSDVLYLVGVDADKIGVGAIRAEEYISAKLGSDVENQVSSEKNTEIFTEYLFEKMGNYGRIRKDSFLQYQLEYIAMGERSDYENLKKIVEELLSFRFAQNVTEAFGDSDLCTQAQVMADNLYAVQLKNEFRKPVTDSIVYAHAYMESVEEIRMLMQGEMLNGYRYEEYLFCFIIELPESVRNLRSMDIMEMDIRYLTGNMDFSMAGCVEKFTTKVQANCNLGEKYSLIRSYGYY